MNWIASFLSLHYTFYVISIIVAIGTTISSLEWISINKSFDRTGLFSWNPRKSRRKIFFASEHLFEVLYSRWGFVVSQLLKTILSLVIIVSSTDVANLSVLFLSLFALDLFESYRGAESSTGADQLLKMLHLICFLHFVLGSELVSSALLVLIFLFLVLAYSTSGWIRIFQEKWRTGENLLVVLRQETYGNKYFWMLASSRTTLTKVISISILVFEILIVVTPFVPLEITIIYLVLGVCFHIINAIVMGLNIFVWAFPATYPAVIWLNLNLSDYLAQSAA